MLKFLVNRDTGKIIDRNPSLNLSKVKLDNINGVYVDVPNNNESEPYNFINQSWKVIPTILREPEYLLYDYISDSQLTNSIITPPHGIDYTINVTPKLKPYRDFRGDGLISKVEWYEYNFNTKKDVKLVISIDIEFEKDSSEIIPYIDRLDGQLYNVSNVTGATDPISFEAARSVVRKITKREWTAKWFEVSGNTNIQAGVGLLSQVVQYSDETNRIKTTIKEYNTNTEKRDEGKRRRKNIYMFIEEELITVLWRVNYSSFTSFDSGSTLNYKIGLALAQNDAFVLLTKYKQQLQKYIDESSPSIISSVITDNSVDVGSILDTTIPLNDPFVLNSNIPSSYYGDSLRKLMIDRLLGEVTDIWVQKRNP